MSNYAMISDYVVSGNENGVVNEVNAALSGNASPLEIINDGLLTGMNVVGEKFANGEMFVPEVLMAARAMNAGMDIVKPLLAEGDVTLWVRSSSALSKATSMTLAKTWLL